MAVDIGFPLTWRVGESRGILLVVNENSMYYQIVQLLLYYSFRQEAWRVILDWIFIIYF